MYELTQLFWYKPIFMTELLIAELLFSVRLARRTKFPLRAAAGLAVCYSAAVGFPIPVYNAAYCSFMFFCFFCVTVAAMKLCYGEPMPNILFCAIAGYTVQHIAFITYDLMSNALRFTEAAQGGIYSDSQNVYAPFQRPETMLTYLFCFIIVYWLSYMLFGKKAKTQMQLKSTVVLVFVGIVVLIEIILRAVITYYEYDVYNRFYAIMLSVFNILCCVITLCFQFELPVRKKLENEVDTLSRLLENAKLQYAVSKENIELINLKCHDLKHQIRMIGRNASIDGAVLDEIGNVISIYDSAVKTGNEALDIILTEKSMLCRKDGILLTCIADGKQLNFMNDVDIYTLFGNAIDNAMEAVAGLDENERNIGITVRKIRTLLSVNVHNYYNKVLEFEHGLPKTTKGDTEHHGYGMRSIKFICEKYGGDMSVNTEGWVFNLNILFFPPSESDERQI